MQAKELTFHEHYLLGDAPFLVELLIQDLRTRRPHLYNSNTKNITNDIVFQAYFNMIKALYLLLLLFKILILILLLLLSSSLLLYYIIITIITIIIYF